MKLLLLFLIIFSFEVLHATEFSRFCDRRLNRSSEYQSKYYHYTQNLLKTVDVNRIKNDYKVFFIAGYFGDTLMALNIPTRIVFGIGDYFKGHGEFLDHPNLQIDNMLIEVGTQDSPGKNALFIKKAIEENLPAHKKAFIIAHSKGGIDALDALVRYPQLQRKVGALVTIQTPFRGSPVADALYGANEDIKGPERLWNAFKRSVLSIVHALTGGDIDSLNSLRSSVRKSYLVHHRTTIQRVLGIIPSLNIGTWLAREKNSSHFLFSFLEGFRNHMKDDLGLESDGLVALPDSTLNKVIDPITHRPEEGSPLWNANYVIFEGADHASIALRSSSIDFDQYSFMKTILMMMLEETDWREWANHHCY